MNADANAVVNRAAIAFAVFCLSMIGKLVVATAALAGRVPALPDSALLTMVGVMVAASLVLAALWFAIARRSNVARVGGLLVVGLAMLASGADALAYFGTNREVSLDSPLAMNGLSGAAVVVVALVVAVVLLRVDTRAVFSASSSAATR